MKPSDVLVVIALLAIGISIGYLEGQKETKALKEEAVQKGAAYYHPATGEFLWVDFYEMMRSSKG